ncbi:MAG: glycosyltransferase family 2 protein [Selenomonas sp.]|uniref:glycosyltransferase family 2 protein n=1 Tax=Selenomonas sp. TaxID=2053611 RepID=UPI0025E855EE|nr:glycosyltransferase family 2 protein [Selenomonas sp.]MCR5439580.1 glycosyltransferase family 2 protein [Selenomonas sp.]
MGKMTSIVILSYNTLAYLQYCIESIRRFTAAGSYELIVVENASKDGSAEWLREQEGIHTIFNTENVGFPKGCNQGMAVAKGDDILLLNSDTIVTANWLDNLKKALYSQEKIGAVGCITNSCSNLQTISVPYKSVEEMLDFAAKFNQSNPRLWERRLRLIGFCLLFKREVYQKIGGLDERFSPGNFEDDDYSLRIWQAGYELLLCRDTFIHHFGSASFQKDDDPEKARKKRAAFRELAARNKQKFLEKWHVPANYQELGLQEVFPDWKDCDVVSCRELLDFVQKKTRISAVVAVYNNLKETQDCLQILQCLLLPYPHEIIVVNNGSSVETSEWLVSQEYLTVICNEQNRGMAAAWNQGAEIAQGDVLMFLHSDAILSEHCIERMLDVLIHQQAGAVGPYFSHSRYDQRAVQYKEYQTYGEFQQTAEAFEQSLVEWEKTIVLESICLMMKKTTYQRVGGFDEQFVLPGWEDLDYSVRMKNAGFTLYRAGVLVHHGIGSFQENGLSAEDVYEMQRKLFWNKWQMDHV